MTIRENVRAIMNYQPYDRLPLVHFGFWDETLDKWCGEGHITGEQRVRFRDSVAAREEIAATIGFDFNWQPTTNCGAGLFPPFDEEVLERFPDGRKKLRDANGAIVVVKEGVVSIPQEVGHTLVDRESWEGQFKPRLQFTQKRIQKDSYAPFMDDTGREVPRGVYVCSMIGDVRNWLGLEGLSYLWVDDEDLFREIVDTSAEMSYQCVKAVLELGAKFDYAHFWEDMSCNNGPLINPDVFRELAGPHYRRVADLLRGHGVDILSVDSDGNIDKLLPVWLDNGIDVMFPIEYGSWHANIAAWRGQYGKAVRGVGGMDKKVFAMDFAAVDAEVERLRPLVELGGYLPCPDHLIPPDAEFANVVHYCERMRKVFG